MAQTTVVKVTVEELTRYGFKANGRYVNYSKQFTDQAKVVPGTSFEAEMYIADSGKEYLNKVLTVLSAPGIPQKAVNFKAVKQPESKPAIEKTVTVKHEFKPKKSDGDMTRADWDAKDRRISRQGCIQVAVQVAGTFEDAVILADKMLEFVKG